MSEVMDHHVEENNSLRDKNRRLSESLKKTRQELEINEITVRAKIAETRRAKDEIVNLSHSLKEARSKLDKQKQESNDERQLGLHTFYNEFKKHYMIYYHKMIQSYPPQYNRAPSTAPISRACNKRYRCVKAR